ncbi:MAG: LEA type 2 family protein [Bacteroidales bacterium]|nr:LEA type 2 family protein [Bacteroidales bacterium]
MKKRLTICIAVLAAMVILAGCSALSGLTSFAKCNFDFNSVTDVTLCGINVNTKKSVKDFNVTDALKLANAFTSKSFPLALNVNVDVKNPNTTTARLDGFDYILWIDDVKMTAGSMSKQVSVGANQKVTMPVNFTFDLMNILKSESRDKLVSFGCGLATNNADASRVKLSIKPYFTIGGTVMKFPSYVTIGGNKIMPSTN